MLVNYVISNNVKTLNNVIDLYIHAFADHKSTFLRVYCEKEEKEKYRKREIETERDAE